MARNIGSGALDRKIEIQRATSATDGFGGLQKTWSKLVSAWAAFYPVSDGEKWRAGKVEATETARFTVRYNRVLAGVTGADRLLFDGKTWQIIGTKEIGRAMWIEITAEVFG